MRSLLTLLFLTFILAACGWQLRGKDSQSEESTGSTLESQGKVVTHSQGNAAKSGIESKAVTAKPSENNSSEKAETEKTPQGLRLVLRERNHGLSAAMNRVAWENKIEFSENGDKWLVIERETLEKRPLTVTETGIAAQYQLILTITFSQQTRSGKELHARQQLVSWRSYDFDPKLIVAKAQEEEALIVEMREEVARRIFALVQH